MMLSILLLVATISPCLALVPKQPQQATRREVVQRLANAALHPPRPRRSNVPCPNFPTGSAPPISTFDGFNYHQYYSSSGFTEDVSNPANDSPNDYPPYTTDLGLLEIPEAIQQCTALAKNDPAIYLTFDLHFLTSTCTWICVQYLGENNDGSYFDQPNADAAIAYGYYVYDVGG